ncbi:LAME_0F09912g1_1 [Lachancea meyersii CBS 8951]|uniref:LAME_0F09912g1_1 n=1 Tax=Lachancea meyersii CBS 8951 TaxID=1266667 RepID=A0A1G4JVF0_9SACH|nr:LAME_0F09912g1_1 [Lachancea meyersii CBS 8951]
MFKKKTEQDPFNHLLNPEPQPVQKGFLQKVVSTAKPAQDEGVSAANAQYSSPFRNSQQLAAAQKRKSQKFPTISASGPGVTGPDLGYKVIDAARKRAKDIAVPKYLQGTDERQRRKLDKLERKEDSLQYKKDSQKIVDVRDQKQRNDTDVDVEEAEIPEPVVETVEPVEPVELVEPVEPVDDNLLDETDAVEPQPDAEFDTAEPVLSQENGVIEPVVNDSELLGAEVPENRETITTEEITTTGTVPPPPPPEPLEISETADIPPLANADNLEHASISAASASAAAPADLENLANDDVLQPASDELTKPKDPKEAPKVPFATGIFALWTRSDKRGQPVASPDDPEFIVRFDKGYMSKALYDTLEYEEAIHNQEMADYTRENEAKYDSKAQEYKSSLTSLKTQISELEAAMEQLRKDTAEKIRISDSQLTTKMIESNAKHSDEKNVIFKATENTKAAKVEEKETVVANQDETKEKIEILEKEKAELEANFQEHQTRVDGLTLELDGKLAAIQELNAKQTEVQESIAVLTERKTALISEAEAHDAQHESNLAVLESIENKEYLPQINAIDTQISGLLTSLTVIKQETVNQEAEFAAVSKRLEEENEARKEKLRQEEEARKRAEEERLQKQREEHDEKVLLLQQEHQREIEEANKQALEAQREHQRQLDEAGKDAALLEQTLQQQREQSALHERELVRLRGEQALQEQENARLADKALEDEMKAKSHSRAEALDAAEVAREKNAQVAKSKAPEAPAANGKSASAVLSNPAENATRDSASFEYFTEKEIAYVTPSHSRA